VRVNERTAFHRLATVHYDQQHYELAENFYLRSVTLCPAGLQDAAEARYFTKLYCRLGDLTLHRLKVTAGSCVYIHVFTFMCLHSCVYVYVFTFMCLHSCVYIHVFTFMCLCLCVYIHVFTFMCLHSCVYMTVQEHDMLYLCVYMRGSKTGKIGEAKQVK